MKNIMLVPLDGMREKAKRIQEYFNAISDDIAADIVDVDIVRFTTGDAKAVLEESIRGRDIFILVDVGNFQCSYSMYEQRNTLSPDEHFHNLVRTISAIGGKADRISVVMPMLYAARQDRRTMRESLDCAIALQHLESIGVKNIMAIDVHDDRVQNAVPFMGFDNLLPTYQMLKAIYANYPDIKLDEKHTIMVSPDFGAINRNHSFAKELGLDFGMFYKKRNLYSVTNGKNEILVHKYLGPSLKGKDVIIMDDIIASGETMLDTVREVKSRGAKRVFVGASFALFTKGIDEFQKAYDDGALEAVFVTNASFVRPEAMQASWYKDVDVTKYIAHYIYAVASGVAVSKIMNPHTKIQDFLKRKQNENSIKRKK